MKFYLPLIVFCILFSCTYSPPSTTTTNSSSGSGGSQSSSVSASSSTSSSSNSSSSGTMGEQDGGGGFGGMITCSPIPEICNGLDDNCDGFIDNSTIDSGKLCGYSQNPLWIGNHNGLCNYGKIECINAQLTCSYISVVTEICNDNLDNDCDGKVDEGCMCNGTETLPCYSGNPDVIDIGVCKWGTSGCDNGMNDGVCISFIPQSTEKCNNKDDDCDGTVDNVEGGCP